MSTQKVQIAGMKRSVNLDDELAAQVDQAASLIKEKPATVLRLAIRAGLPAVTNQFQAPRPEGYFADAYRGPRASARARFERRLAKSVVQHPER